MRIKHYIKPLKVFANTEFENLIWQLSVVLISGVMSFASFTTGVGILFFPMFAVLCITVLGILVDIFFAIKTVLAKSNSKM
ncbi:hypothetical protein J7384_16640 [Endozoicomonas sp. G2_1]|uniref:hypothetical protein n=1 Tax=Endozoicomonas sp. G2_1 TaxID=2821091 RepID=UPI001ADB884E|nr:hypothetical protein [Endozoicomonas sp. G2_1]MBO9491990.1 hypothetical protein [Endozoicomonas sp. G2_1]